MERIHTILTVALCAIILSLVAVNDSWGITNLDIYRALRQNPEYTPPANDHEFEEDILFPPPYDADWNGEFPVGQRHLNDGTYTLNLEAGEEYTFEGSLTIQETEYDEDETVGIGRIQAVGAAGNMVTLDEAGEGWGGVIVATFPEGENLIRYCELTNVDGIAIQIGTANIPAQCVVERSHIHDNGGFGNGIQVWGPVNDGSDFSIRSNVIHDNGWRGIEFDGTFVGQFPELAIVNNVVFDNPGDGIQLHNTRSEIWVANNIVFGNDASQIDLDLEGGEFENPVVINNVIDGQEQNVTGLNVLGRWSEQILNNIIVNCNVGINNGAGGNPEVDFQLIFNCDPPLEGCQDANDDIIDADPEFVDDANGDYHLLWDSPAINEGDPDEDCDDPDGSDNDMGGFGGPRADDFNRAGFEDYCVMPGGSDIEDVGGTGVVLWDTYRMTGTCDIEANESLTLAAGTSFMMDEDVMLKIKGTAEFNGDDGEGEQISFVSMDGEDNWTSIKLAQSYTESNLTWCVISGAAWGLDIQGCNSSLSDINISNVSIQDCADGGIRINDSYVDIDSDEAAPDDNDNVIDNCGDFGIDIDAVNSTQVELRYIDISNCETGIDLFAADPEIEFCHIHNNTGVGINASWGSLPDLVPTVDNANTIQNNDGTEIELNFASNPDINDNNIIDFVDIAGHPVDGLMIDADDLGPFWEVDAVNNFYGEGVEVGDEDFVGDVVWDPPAVAAFDGAEIDNAELDRRSMLIACWNDGDFEGVIEIGIEILEDPEADNGELSYAVHYLLPAYKAVEGELSDLRDVYFDAAETFEDSDFKWILYRYAARCLTDLGRDDEAIAEYEAAQQRAIDADNELIAIFTEIDALNARIAADLEGNVDNITDYEARLRELRKTLRELEQNPRSGGDMVSLPTTSLITAAYPNPFNSRALLSYQLSEATYVTIKVFDVKGREVTTLLNGHRSAGSHSLTWNGVDSPSGIYICRMEAGHDVTAIKLNLMR